MFNVLHFHDKIKSYFHEKLRTAKNCTSWSEFVIDAICRATSALSARFIIIFVIFDVRVFALNKYGSNETEKNE